MTKAAKAFGKRLDHFFENMETQRYMKELALHVSTTRNSGELDAKSQKRLDWFKSAPAGAHIYGVDIAAFRKVLTQATPGGYGGTWAHPKLAVFFARWLDVKFSVWCDSIIDDILRGRMVPVQAPQAPAAQILIDGVDVREALRAANEASAMALDVAKKALQALQTGRPLVPLTPAPPRQLKLAPTDPRPPAVTAKERRARVIMDVAWLPKDQPAYFPAPRARTSKSGPSG